MANVKVRLKDASKNVLHPETDWSVVLNKPSNYPSDWSSSVSNKPFHLEKDSSGDDVLAVTGFKTFKFNHDEMISYSFGYCTYNETGTNYYTPAFFCRMWGNGGYVRNAYYRYKIGDGTWESFTPGDTSNQYYPLYTD